MDWYRSWHGAPTDPKWMLIARKANTLPGIVSAVFWALLDHASQQADRGCVKSFDAETYAVYSGFDLEDIERILAVMGEKGIITDGRLAAWDKRQPQREDNSANRTAAYRERKRAVTHGDASVTHGDAAKRNVTQGDDRSDQIREEKNRSDQSSSAEDQAGGEDDFVLVERAHGQYVGPKMSLEQSKTYEQWLKETTPQAIIDALAVAAQSATRNGGRYKYAMAVLAGQKRDRTLPLPAKPPEPDVLILPPEMTSPMSWL